MGKLPLRPLFFLPAYLLTGFVSAYPVLMDIQFAEFWSLLLGLSAAALQFTWTYRALAFASKRLQHLRHSVSDSQPLRTALRILLMLIAFFAGIALYKGYLQAAVFGGTLLDQPIAWFLAFGAAILFFGIFWIPARALCEAEMGRKVPAHSVVGTFLLFVYIVIGAPFIYRRLKHLRDQPIGGYVGTD